MVLKIRMFDGLINAPERNIKINIRGANWKHLHWTVSLVTKSFSLVKGKNVHLNYVATRLKLYSKCNVF